MVKYSVDNISLYEMREFIKWNETVDRILF